MPRFVKLLGTQVLEDELLLLHTCAMLSQASSARPRLFSANYTHGDLSASQKPHTNGSRWDIGPRLCRASVADEKREAQTLRLRHTERSVHAARQPQADLRRRRFECHGCSMRSLS